MVYDVNTVKNPRGWKPKAESTLNNMRKDKLIEYVRILEHNWGVAEAFNSQQIINFNNMANKCIEDIEKEKVIAFLTLANATDIPEEVYNNVSIYLDKAKEIIKKEIGGLQ